MSMIKAVTPFFGPEERRLGAMCRRQGGVAVTRVAAEEVRATVLDDETHAVVVRRKGEQVAVECDCKEWKRRSRCAHVWAVLLEIQARGHIGVEPQEPDREPAWTDDGDDVFEDEDADLGLPQSPRTLAVPGDAWMHRLARVTRPAPGPQPEWPSGREIHYVVHVPGTRQAGKLGIDITRRDPKRGGFTRWKECTVSHALVEQIPDAADRYVLSILLGGDRDEYAYGFANGSASQFTLTGALERLVVPLLCETGRLHLGDDAGPDKAPALAWDAASWTLRLEVTSARKGFAVQGNLEREGERLGMESAVLLTPKLVFFRDRVAPLEAGGAEEWMRELARAGPLFVPKRAKRALLHALVSGPMPPGLHLPSAMGTVEDEPRAMRPRLRVASSSGLPKSRLACQVSFDYGDKSAPAEAPGWALQFEAKGGPTLLVRRDLAAEATARDRIEAAGVRRTVRWGVAAYELPVGHLARAVSALTKDGWRVEADGKLYRSAGPIHVSVVSGIDWFDLEAAVDFEGESVPLPRILAALKRGESTIALGDGTVGMLPDEWLARYALWSRFGSVDGDRIRFRPGQAAILDALLAAVPEANVDEGFARARASLNSFAGIVPDDAPKTFTGTLRAYQRDGLGWMRFLREFGFGGCLADDMGLGKTVQVLALLDGRREEGVARPSLVVAPRSVVFNWRKEAERFTPRLRVLDHVGPDRPRKAAGFASYDLILTTYGTLRRDAALLKDLPLDYAILDEAQAIKNARTDSAKAARLLQADHRLALSGTPVENHLGELWSLFEFLNPGLLGRASALDANRDEESRRFLARALRPYVLRRTKEEVAKDLPAKVEQTLYCEMDKAQRELCDELKEHYRRALLERVATEGLGKSKIQVLEALLRLRQAACHPGLLDPARAQEPSAKLDVLLPRLQEVLEEGHKALVFSQFTSFLAIVRARLDAAGIPYAYLDGATRDREAVVRRFQEDPACGTFLISLKAGGLGLNLTAAQYVFLLDPWWNPAVEAQAVDRSHRIGQSRQVFAYRLVVRGSIEEKVLALQESKRGLADAILGADSHLIRDIGREDLELLLS